MSTYVSHKKKSTFTHYHIFQQNVPKDFTVNDCMKIYSMFGPIIQGLDKALVAVVAKKPLFDKRGDTKVVHDNLVTQKTATGDLSTALMNKAPVRMFRFGLRRSH
jgi:hypothetical protein